MLLLRSTGYIRDYSLFIPRCSIFLLGLLSPRGRNYTARTEPAAAATVADHNLAPVGGVGGSVGARARVVATPNHVRVRHE